MLAVCECVGWEARFACLFVCLFVCLFIYFCVRVVLFFYFYLFFVCPAFAVRSNLQELIRILRALCPSSSSEKTLAEYQVALKHSSRSASGMQLWCNLEKESKSRTFQMSNEFHMLKFSRPLAQHDHSCFVRRYSCKVALTFFYIS